MENFWIAVNAVVPFCIYIAFGLFARSIGLVAEDFTKQLNQMVFRAFFPIMMFYNLYSMDFSQRFDGKLVLVGVAALFVLGSTLHFSSIRKNLKYLVSALGLKLVLIPSIIMVLAVNLRFRPVECFVLFAMFATPVAAASYPMAQNMGGDGELAGELVVTSTVVSVFTIFFWIYFLKSIGVF